jgi:hypothetical protein
MDNKGKYGIIALVVALVAGIAVVPLVVIMATATLVLPSTIDRCQAASLDQNGVGVGGAGYTVMSYLQLGRPVEAGGFEVGAGHGDEELA